MYTITKKNKNNSMLTLVFNWYVKVITMVTLQTLICICGWY